MPFREVTGLVRVAFRGWVDDAAPTMGAALAFYTLFSLAPLFLVVIAVAALAVGRADAQALVVSQVTYFVGETAANAVASVLESTSRSEGGIIATLVGGLTVVLGATTVFAELRGDLNRIWRHRPPRSGGVHEFLGARAAAFALVAAVGLLLLASLVASTVLVAMGSAWFPGFERFARAIEFGVTFALITLLFALIYKVLPSARIDWRDVWVGAAVTSLLFWIGKYLISLYLARAAVGSAFGAGGAIVVLIVWVYYSAQIFFLGAEFTRAYALRHGRGGASAAPEPATD